MEEPVAISRRGFLGGAAVLGVAGALGTLGQAYGSEASASGSLREPAAVSQTIECDIVIVGAGGSGLAAAVEAGEAGAKVICLEREEDAGGGEKGVEGVFAVGSRMQKAQGIEASAGALIRSELEAGQQRVNGPAYVDMVHASGDDLDWLLDHGVTFMDEVEASFGDTAVFHHFASGAGASDYIEPMLAAAETAGVTFMYSTTATELIKKGDAVTGLIATAADGSVLQVNASSVIIATGGFAEDFELVAENGINTEGANYVGMPGHDGTGHRMAIGAGAKSNRQNAAYLAALAVNGLPGYFAGGKFSFWIGVTAPYTMWVNQNGERFVNEDFAAANAMLMTVPEWKNQASYILMDSTMMDTYTGGDSDSFDQLQAGIDSGEILKAQSVEELASTMGVGSQALSTTIERYNGYCTDGSDEDYGKDQTLLMALEEAPFYAVCLTLEIQVSIGSIATNRDFNAIDESGNPIEGLYVVGVEGCMLWANIYTINISGGCNANNVYSGRTAAKQALARIR